jgi:hypothetical protein
MKFSHLFVIGFNKSATTAIHQLFTKSRVPSIHWDGGRMTNRMVANLASGKRILTGYDRKFVVFSDFLVRGESFWIEGNQFFCQMAEDYPDAGFLYNFRNIDDWISSRLAHKNRWCNSTEWNWDSHQNKPCVTTGK